MTLRYTANCWITGHLGDEVEVHRDHGGFQAQAGTGAGGLAACVAGAHHYDIIIDHNLLFSTLF
jgi:ABC-type sulfate transport system substrate-binding protein